MYPVDSLNHSLNDLGILSEEISYWKDRGVTPFFAGYFNAQVGDLNKLAEKSTLKWKYDQNVDKISNPHGSHPHANIKKEFNSLHTETYMTCFKIPLARLSHLCEKNLSF